MCYCVDPDLVYDKCLERDDGFENALDLFPAGYRPTTVQPEMSGGLPRFFLFNLGMHGGKFVHVLSVVKRFYLLDKQEERGIEFEYFLLCAFLVDI